MGVDVLPLGGLWLRVKEELLEFDVIGENRYFFKSIGFTLRGLSKVSDYANLLVNLLFFRRAWLLFMGLFLIMWLMMFLYPLGDGDVELLLVVSGMSTVVIFGWEFVDLGRAEGVMLDIRTRWGTSGLFIQDDWVYVGLQVVPLILIFLMIVSWMMWSFGFEVVHIGEVLVLVAVSLVVLLL